MRTEAGLLALSLAAVLALAGCPGTLDDKASFEAAANAGASGRVGAAGSAGNAGSSAGNVSVAGGSPDAGTDPCDTLAKIIVPNCGDSGCHGSVATQMDLDLVSPGVASRIVGVPGTGCPITLADPTNPEGSLMYQKLLSPPPCGAQMPLARPALSSDDVTCIRNWIAGLQ